MLSASSNFVFNSLSGLNWISSFRYLLFCFKIYARHRIKRDELPAAYFIFDFISLIVWQKLRELKLCTSSFIRVVFDYCYQNSDSNPVIYIVVNIHLYPFGKNKKFDILVCEKIFKPNCMEAKLFTQMVTTSTERYRCLKQTEKRFYFISMRDCCWERRVFMLPARREIRNCFIFAHFTEKPLTKLLGFGDIWSAYRDWLIWIAMLMAKIDRLETSQLEIESRSTCFMNNLKEINVVWHNLCRLSSKFERIWLMSYESIIQNI